MMLIAIHSTDTPRSYGIVTCTMSLRRSVKKKAANKIDEAAVLSNFMD